MSHVDCEIEEVDEYVLENYEEILNEASDENYLDYLNDVLFNISLSVNKGNEEFGDVYRTLHQIALISLDKGHYGLSGFEDINYPIGTKTISYKELFLRNYTFKEEYSLIESSISKLDLDLFKELYETCVY